MSEGKAHWVCSVCGDIGDNVLIIHTFNGQGKVVDIIDVMCKGSKCAGDVKIVGTKEQIDEWWKADYEKVEY